MPYQDAGQQSHQLATWAHSITQGRSPPSRGAQLTPNLARTEKPLHTNFFVRLIETKSFTYSYAQDTRGFSGINDFVSISSEKKSIFFIQPFSLSPPYLL